MSTSKSGRPWISSYKLYFTCTGKVQLGILLALEDDGSTPKCAVTPISIFEGRNVVGRDDLVLASKQVSRKHVAITASNNGTCEIAVEGQNPVVIRSGTTRTRLLPKTKADIASGDVVEFLPGQLCYRLNFASPTDGLPILSSFGNIVQAKGSMNDILVEESGGPSSSDLKSQENSATVVVRNQEIIETTVVTFDHEEEQITKKRKRQMEDDEAFARALQDEEDRAARTARGNVSSSLEHEIRRMSHDSRIPSVADEMEEAFGVEYDAGCKSSSTFRLMRVKGLPHWANKGCVSIQDVVQGDVQVALLSNYMVDIDWLLGACPRLRTVPSVVVIHGESGGSLGLLQASKPQKWALHKPPLRLSYGTHHSKAMFLIYSTGVRVVVHTANLIYVDWNNKSQGLWMQDFPYKSENAKESKSAFENDLVEYLQALEWSGCKAVIPGLGEVQVNAAYFRRFDYRNATVRLIASVPGNHQGRNLAKWGHTKLRSVLQEQCFDKEFVGAPCIYQFSSLGSLDEKWLSELAASMQEGSTPERMKLGPGQVQIVWPSVEDIRCSLEGYAAGNAVPSPQKNVERAFLSKYWSRWQADHTGRSRAIPHIKTFVRYNNQNLAWVLLTSSNLSKAAWGALVKNGSQLMVRSYELGVLFLPSLVAANSIASPFSCCDTSLPLTKEIRQKSEEDENPQGKQQTRAKLVTLSWKSSSNGDLSFQDTDTIVRLPLPYAIPPSRYTSQDIPWSWDKQYRQPDVYGEPWPRSVQLYKQLA